MKVGQAAFITVTGTALATGGFAIAAVATASKAAAIVFGILGVVSATANITAITAWLGSNKNDSAATYFNRMGSHASKAIPGAFTFISQLFIQAIIQGVVDGIRDLISGRISGHPPARVRVD